MSNDHRRSVVFKLGQAEYVLSVAEALDLQKRITEAVNATRVKCPTCRYRNLPGEECSCCRCYSTDDDEPGILELIDEANRTSDELIAAASRNGVRMGDLK